MRGSRDLCVTSLLLADVFLTRTDYLLLLSSEILIHHAKQRPCNFPSEKKIPVFILEKFLSENMKFY